LVSRVLRYAAAVLVGGSVGYLSAEDTPQRVALTAMKYEFSSKEVRVRKGRPVTFVLSTSDFVHGFSVPDLKARVDLVPGKSVELTITPDKAGRYVFLCDNFCGDGHERMTGFIVVTD
jgi:cytochrome c oxidase subunit 2